VFNVSKKAKYLTVGQIDSTGVRGPHEKELRDISNAKVDMFKELSELLLKKIVKEDIGGTMGDIGFNEDWTINIQFFPEANIHISYFYYGDEFGDIEAELKFLFSGKRIYLIPGEDSATFIDLVIDFLERRIKNRQPFEKTYEKRTQLMKKVLKQRKQPFELLRDEDKKDLESFLDANVKKNEAVWIIKKEVFPQIYIDLTFDNNQKKLDISFSGGNLEKIGSYHIELVGIFLINHILRYITLANKGKDLPEICNMMFSRLYTKQQENQQ
jgi:hypothetical protein